MLKKLKNLKHPDLIRYTLINLLIICAVAVALALLWDNFLNNSELVLWHHTLAIIGLIYATIAWFFYLALDGFSPFRFLKQKKEIKHDSKYTYTPSGKKRDKGSMTEYIYTPQEPPITVGGDMDPQDLYLCYFAAFLASAALLQIPSFFGYLLR